MIIRLDTLMTTTQIMTLQTAKCKETCFPPIKIHGGGAEAQDDYMEAEERKQN